MTNSKNKYVEEDLKHVQDDCIGDTVSEGDTSDDEDFDASRNKNGKRSTVSLESEKSLQVASGSADEQMSPRTSGRKLFHFLIAIAAVVAISAAVGVGIFVSRKKKVVPSTSTTVETEINQFSESSSTAFDSGSITEVDPRKEGGKENIADSNPPSVSKDDTFGILEELLGTEDNVGLGKEQVGSDDETVSTENIDKKESQQTKWPELVGMTGTEAKDQLELLCGEETYDIHVLHENSPTTRDYRFNRIRIFTNDEGIVTRVPQIG
mmetsp:Transcript_23182/g.54815  ORF Transcript_23182/g.54815 Transcript_23182/m.54815 type:complete len:266 (+) Transcript_23182:73-870(+)|eukprot:CAMPEP_0197173258 /NCGR_PEP_ID=MMETSP1423-20130617/266_1 /TAXON_ID=476441 /ORGANISM="Pseudo-nitzschia heimii, Strain UNC1101" /LENGTH=265 /DNA_ID=CAMNT_0042622053 /DNA_START=74 /DNA_END=871 /DNA_ORIENTATION=+